MVDELVESIEGEGPTGSPAGTHPVQQALIVEDDPQLGQLLKHWIRERYPDSTEIQHVSDVDSAEAEIARRASLDLVLVDRRLPGGTGDELAIELVERFDPILVMITGVDPDVEIIRLPITDYLVKPVDRGTVLMRLALLEKLATANAIDAYREARKAALLEFHLENPEGNPLFRQFAARWRYDRLEVATTESTSYVYELYVGDDEQAVSVSVIGRLDEDLATACANDVLSPVGEIVPTEDHPVWLDVDRPGPIDPPPEGYAVYEFSVETPESHVDPTMPPDATHVARTLERAYE